MCLKTFTITMGFACLVLFIYGCRSNPGVDQSVLDHQRQVTELEARNRELTERLDRYDHTVGRSVTELRDISDRAGQMGSTVDELINLFDEYQRGVEQLIRNYYAARGETPPTN